VTTAAGRDAWDRTWIGWDAAFGVVLAVALVVAATDPDLDGRGRAVTLAALGAWYAAVGARALRDDDTDRLAWAYLAGMIPLFLVAYAHVGTVGLMLFVLYPQAWAVFEGNRAAVWANVLLTVSVGLVAVLWFEDSPAAVTVQLAVSLGFSVAMGLWIGGIVRQSAGRKAVIAELEETRAELAAVSREAGVRAERERLAREIHDTLAQGFTSVVLLLELAESEIATDPAAARRRLAGAWETARQNLAEARALVAALTPVDLQEAPLPQAIGRLVDRFGAETGLPVHLSVDGEPRPLPANIEVVLLRAAQEALTNVRKHARARQVTVALRYGEGTQLCVADDGTGFDPAAPADGYGLAGMRRRVEETGGALAVRSGPAGTAVEVRC
jgi:signal transduction histidine kinase